MNRNSNLERPPFTKEQIERHLHNCEDWVTEARDILEWVWNKGYGREVVSHNMDQTVSEDFERIAQFLIDTKPPEPKEDHSEH
jgi:hypothetical protein